MTRLLPQRLPSMTRTGMVADALVGFVALVLAAWTLPGEWSISGMALQGWPTSARLVLFAADFALVMSLTYAFAGLYRPTSVGIFTTVRRTLVAVAVGALLSYWSLRQLAEPSVAQALVESAVAYLLAGLLILRFVWFAYARTAISSRLLIVGSGEDALAVARDVAESKRIRREIAGVYDVQSLAKGPPPPSDAWPIFGREHSLSDLVSRMGVTEIIVSSKDQRGGSVPMDELLRCRIRGIPVLDLAGFYERTRAEVPLESLKASWLVYGDGFVQGRLRALTKRTFDLITSTVLLVLALPVMLLTMLAIRLDSPGPVIYSQPRIGRGGKTFMCLKFRSMRTDAERDGVARWAAKNDSRVTRVGSFIRKTRIDELPQLVSVLRGEMSMVGPRPERPAFVSQLRELIPYYDLRHSIKPGVTGWAQVRYSYGSTLDDARRKHQFDLYYVKNNSIWLDLLVLVETVSVVLFREGQ